ncbi:carboxypeptidase-like regulatory domain-containing protein [Alloiococcus sp. CFN-8]|uniref:carboxypeptidase-like regulatory domain-containing protein n=1 Tax=Alloiococcus sp. CFN-8 TaxID=3416081 RepID=UPI003CE7676C
MKVRKIKFAKRGISIFLVMIFVASLVINDLAPIMAGAEELIDSFTVVVKGDSTQGAEVTFAHKNNEENIISEVVNEDGKAVFQNRLSADATYRLQITGIIGYQDYSEEVDLSGYTDKTMEINLVPMEKIFVSGKVFDEEDNPLKDVEIKSQGYSEATAATSLDGSFSLEVYKGQAYSLTASKTGYQLKSIFSGVIITEDNNVIAEPIRLMKNVFTITINESNRGRVLRADNVDIEDNEIILREGESVELLVVNNPGFKLIEVKVNGTKVNPNENGNYLISNIKENITFEASFKDTVLPVIEDIEVSKENSWAKEKFITYEVRDNDEVKGVYYSYTLFEKAKALIDDLDKTAWKADSSIRVNRKGTVYIYALDADDNMSRAEVAVDKIDTTAPKIVDMKREETGNRWYPRVTFSFKVEEAESGIDRVYYALSEDADYGIPIDMDENGVYSFRVRENQKWYIFAVDKAGNKYVTSETTDNIDAEAPTITEVQASEEWNASRNTVTFQATDNRKLTKVYYSVTDEYEEGLEGLIELDGTDGRYSFQVTENGEYYIFAVDEAGNVGRASVEVDRIDNKRPEIKNVEKSTKGQWDNGSVNIYITAEDSQSGVSKVFYSTKYQTYEEAESKNGLIEAVYENGRYIIEVPDEEFNGSYYIWAVDRVDRVSAASSIDIKLDKIAPTDLNLTYVVDKDKGFIKDILDFLGLGFLFKDKIYITMEAKDNREAFDSGLVYYEYQMVSDGDELSEDHWEKVESQENKVEVKIAYREFHGRIYFRAWDKAGNKTEAVTDKDGTTIIIDNETSLFAPTVSIKDYKEGVWTNRPVVITLEGAATLSGVDYYEYRIEYADPARGATTWTRMPETDGLLPHVSGGTIDNQITLKEDFNGRLYFRAVSNNLNPSPETKGAEVKLQRTLPENTKLILQEPNGTNGWYVGSYPSIKIEEPAQGEYLPEVTAYYKLWNETKGEREETAEEITFDGANNPVINEDGIYKLMVWTVDEAGNPSSDSSLILKEIKVDITAPDKLDIRVSDKSILPENSNSISYNLFYDKEIKLILSGDTDISGLKALTYQKVKGPQDYDLEKGTWHPYDPEEGVVIAPNDRFVLYLKAEDMAGNITIVNSDGVIVDNKPPTGENYAPEIIITPEAANKNGYHNKDVRVQLTAIDPKYRGSIPDSVNGYYSGLAELSYRIISEDRVTKEERLVLEGSGAEIIKDETGLIHSFKSSIVISSQENNSNKVVVEVTAIDKAGNVTVTRTPVGAIKIDTTAPRIDVSYNNNSADSGSFFKEDRIATITITERNFNNNDVKLQITNSDGEIPSVTTWERVEGTGNEDNTIHRATLSYRVDGDYTFTMEYTDLADNKANGVNYSPGTIHSEEFTIDKTLPKVSVAYDNNGVRNGKFFNQGRTATITVEEHNFTPDRTSYTVTAMKDGAPISPPTLSGWSRNGDVYTARLSFSQDGDYTFDFKLSDMAGNEDQGVNYGGSAASQDFVLDTTIEAPIINGVVNGNAYKGEVVPEIQVSDINFEGYRLSLLRTRRGEINVDVTQDFLKELSTTPKGASGIHDSFQEIKENDGIYTLTATVMDKAGNEESTTVTFSVNRFGSVYVYNDYLAELQDAYVQEVDASLVITEYNPNKLLEGSTRVEITLDGKPLEDIAYEISPVVNSSAPIGSSGWYQYDYSIAASNFEKDGIYKVVVSSEDEAGNKPENINDEEGEVLFRVDTTAPEIANIRGLDSKYHNAEVLEVDFDIFDSIGLKEASVFVSGKEVAVFNNFENLTSFTGTFEIGEGMNQEIKIVVEDLAGNVTDTSEEGFKPGFAFENNITVSTNGFIRLYANKPLFGSTVASALALIAGGSFYVFKRRTKFIKLNK